MSQHSTEPVEHARPRRLTLTDIVERLLQRGGSEHSSVTLGRNSKGDATLEVIVRTGEESGITTIEEAAAAAIVVYDDLRARYPFGQSTADAS